MLRFPDIRRLWKQDGPSRISRDGRPFSIRQDFVRRKGRIARSLASPIANPCVLLLLALSACTEAENAADRNIEVVALQHSEVWSKGDLSRIPGLYSEDFVGHAPGGRVIRGLDGIRSTVENHRIAFPDWKEEIEQIVADGDFVTTRFRSTGTHRGTFLGHPPSGNKIEITELCMYRMEDGKIAEQWIHPDIATLLEQIAADETAQ